MIKVNEYFDGNVKSMGCNNSDGELTVGVMAKGSYIFGTSKKEYMHVVSGSLSVVFPDHTEAQVFGRGSNFVVDANKSFAVEALEETIYTCRYE